MASLKQLANLCRNLVKRHVDDPNVPSRDGRCGRVRPMDTDCVNIVPRRTGKEAPRNRGLPQRDARCPC
jgi:hypothetical protein